MAEAALETREASPIQHTSTAPDISEAPARFEAELRHAEELKMAIGQSPQDQLGQFDVFRDAVEALMQQSWFSVEEQPTLQQRIAALYQTALRWKQIYEHLHFADERRERLMAKEEPGRTSLDILEHQIWEEFQQHVAALAPHEAFFTPDMEVRYRQLCATIRVWQTINDHLYYGGEAMAVIQTHFSPPNIQKLRGEVMALKESSLLFAAYPLQIRRADALIQFCVENVRKVFDHATSFSESQTGSP